MLRLSTTKISDGVLLENLEDGKIVEAEEWNSVMQNIKNAVNTNADALLNVGIVAIPIVVSSNTQYPNTKTWTASGNYFSVTLSKTDYQVDGPKSIRTYLIAGIQSDGSPTNILEEVQNSIKYSGNNLTVSSKSNAPILIIIQGVGV